MSLGIVDRIVTLMQAGFNCDRLQLLIAIAVNSLSLFSFLLQPSGCV